MGITMMKTLQALAAVMVFAQASHANAEDKSRGCGLGLPSTIHTGGQGESNRVSLTTADRRQRSYLLHIPTGYDKNRAHPLVFSFHGRDENAAHQEELSRFSDRDLNPHMIAVYPEGVERMWQGGGDPGTGVDDVSFVLQMIDHLEGKFCIDKNRVYASGKSNGGGFSARVLACDSRASKKIAAFAGVAGAYYSGTTSQECDPETIVTTCSPGRKPIPIIEFHGTGDETIAYEGGPRRNRCLPTIPHFMKAWALRDGFDSKNVTTPLFDGHVHKYEYGESAGKLGMLTHYKTKGFGHKWPSTTGNDDGPATYLDASTLIMDFFARCSLATDPGTPTKRDPESRRKKPHYGPRLQPTRTM